MRHRKNKGRISRNISHRKALLKNMANALFTHQRIETTMAKAKALRSFAEPLITLAKKDPGSVFAKREAYRKLCNRDVVTILFRDLAPLFKDVPGGYTRIMLLGARKGDGASMVIMELTKRTISDEELLGAPKAPKKKELLKKTSKKEKEPKKEAKKEVKEPKEEIEKEKAYAAPDIDIEKKEEHFVEDVKKEKAKKEQKKITKRGFFRRFQRKSMD